MRNEVEKIIKEFQLDRTRIFEVSHLKYEEIIRKIEERFIINAGELHWVNTDYRFKPNLILQSKYIGNHRLWYHLLDKMIPDTLHYVLFEDTKNLRPKYWVYEMFTKELVKVLDESCCLSDFYIVSKKFEWLISENHEEVVCVVGDGIDISLITEDSN